MQIPSNTYPVTRTSLAPAPRREDTQAEDVVVPAQEVPGAKRQAMTALPNLPVDMLQAALRGRSAEAGSSFSSQQAVAEYADVARQDGGSASLEVLGFDAYV